MAKVLVVEDDAHVIRLMSMWLTHNNHQVLEAHNGEEAKTFLNEGDVECVVTDINMPHCDGIQLVQWLRKELRLEIPVITLSARCDQARLGEELAGMNVSIHPKPFSPLQLSAEIESALKRTTAGTES